MHFLHLLCGAPAESVIQSLLILYCQLGILCNEDDDDEDDDDEDDDSTQNSTFLYPHPYLVHPVFII